MAIKHKIKFKIDRDRGTNPAKGVSLDLSDDGQPSNDSRRPLGESARRSVSQDEMKQPIFINEDEEYCKHLAKFFKGKCKHNTNYFHYLSQKLFL